MRATSEVLSRSLVICSSQDQTMSPFISLVKQYMFTFLWSPSLSSACMSSSAVPGRAWLWAQSSFVPLEASHSRILSHFLSWESRSGGWLDFERSRWWSFSWSLQFLDWFSYWKYTICCSFVRPLLDWALVNVQYKVFVIWELHWSQFLPSSFARWPLSSQHPGKTEHIAPYRSLGPVFRTKKALWTKWLCYVLAPFLPFFLPDLVVLSEAVGGSLEELTHLKLQSISLLLPNSLLSFLNCFTVTSFLGPLMSGRDLEQLRHCYW